MAKLLVAALAILLVSIGSPPQAGAILTLDSSSFGTAVHFGFDAATCCVALPSVGIIQDGVRQSSDIKLGLGESAQGRAFAGNPVLPELPFELGIQIVEANPFSRNQTVGAIAASGVTVSGLASASFIRGSITLTGNFVFPPPSSLPPPPGEGGAWIVDLFVTDFLGHFLAQLDIGSGTIFDPQTGAPVGFGPTFTADFCPNPLEERCRFENAGFGPWGGSFVLPFNLPIFLNQDNGVIVELFGIASAPSLGEVRVEFLGSARLSFLPPPGVIVTLASGPTFGEVPDTAPPDIASLTATPGLLWPPDHKMVPVAVAVSMSDNLDPAPVCRIVAVSSSEPVIGTGDGVTAPDWQISGPLTVNLRAERSGTGSGRTYTITVQCTDASGNSSTKSVTVTVPHDRRGAATGGSPMAATPLGTRSKRL
jgi:hypothetical protein